MIKSIARLADYVEKRTIRAYNRTGSTLVRGNMVALDLTGSDTDVATWAEQKVVATNLGQAGDPFANVIAPVTAHLTGWIFCVCQEVSLLDNSAGTFLVEGITPLSVTSGAVVKGDKLMGANGVFTTLKRTDANAGVALALEVNGSAAINIDVYFKGDCLNAAGAAS